MNDLLCVYCIVLVPQGKESRIEKAITLKEGNAVCGKHATSN